jgi:arabinogalactan oligomer / maltooligosaccharide transport system permease protein
VTATAARLPAMGREGTSGGTATQGRRWWHWATHIGWRHLVGVLALAFALFPIVFVVSAALNPIGTLSSSTLIPHAVSLKNFSELLSNPNYPFLDWLWNSLLICGIAMIFCVFFSVSAAYAFSRLRFRGRKVGLQAVVLIQMFPQFLAVTALYLMFASIGNTFPLLAPGRVSLVLIYLGGALGVNTWLMKGYIDTIPAELDEAATIDGASHAQIFFGIVLRLAAPILVVSAVIAFIGTLNEFIIANLFLTSGSAKTVIVGLYGFVNGQQNQDYGQFAAGALMAGVPVIVLFLVFQRFLVGGLVRGAVKT